MLFGAHVSIADGLENAPGNAAQIGCEVFQMFTRSPQGGTASKITPQIIDKFRTRCQQHKLKEWVIHTPYYINFASEEARIRNASVRIVREELERGSLLSAAFVMFHPGSSRTVGEKDGLMHCIEGIKKALDGYAGHTRLLIELSAGAGAVIGDRFEEVAEILNGVGHPDMGVCFDTAHAFASGYDLRDAKAVKATFNQFDRIIGLKRLKMSHCNDSKVELGARRDRHEHIGAGFIGLDGFKAIVSSKQLAHINLYLETESDGVAEDLKTLKRFRG